ncbi:MAG: phosphoribosylformylglycinamidine synthase [Gammaproteobacteria bacterium]
MSKKILTYYSNVCEELESFSKKTIERRELFLIKVESNFQYEAELCSILNAENLDFSPAVIIGPRPGTKSPWSSKTEDILNNCGIDDVHSIEKFECYISDEITNKDITELPFDRMIQERFESLDVLLSSVNQLRNSKAHSVNLLKEGIGALSEVNDELGLALNDEEMRYLYDFYSSIQRNPTDTELMMFAQANSEHCRHKIFNAHWEANGERLENTLFEMIKQTSSTNPAGLISAYKDNAAVIEGKEEQNFYASREHVYQVKKRLLHPTLKVETHNHPTAISPFPGAATGSGGEIRDEGATGSGAKPKVGVVGFNVSHLHLPNSKMPWEKSQRKPDHIASPLEIMLEGPLGGAAFNNEFGRPCTSGYFRVLESWNTETTAVGYHKPIMLAGGLGEIRDEYALKSSIPAGSLVIVLGGPAMLIGLGGGAASSMGSGTGSIELDFASVQRENAEMQRRCQEVINTCINDGDNLIEFIHDVGAGGLSNAIPELAKDTGLGVEIEYDSIPKADKSLSPMELWCNESQERYVIAINSKSLKEFTEICNRERCPFAVVGKTTLNKEVILRSSSLQETYIDLPLSMLFGNLPIKSLIYQDSKQPLNEDDLDSELSLENSIVNILQHPSIGSKSFLISIADRSVGGLTAQDQMVGPYQIPVSNYSLALTSFFGNSGQVLAIGEKPNIADINPAASLRMAMGELITNLISVPITNLSSIKISANWMAACGTLEDDSCLRDAVQSLSNIAQELGIAIPVGKDSLSMKTKWQEDTKSFEVKSPVTGVLTGIAPCDDIKLAITQEFSSEGDKQLLILSLSPKQRMGGSIFCEVTGQSAPQATPDIENINALKELFDFVQREIAENNILALHDISDGGSLVSALEMSFVNKVGLNIKVDNNKQKAFKHLFNEEIGLLVQTKKGEAEKVIRKAQSQGLHAEVYAEFNTTQDIVLFSETEACFKESINNLELLWNSTSKNIKAIRNGSSFAEDEFVSLIKQPHPLHFEHTFENAPMINTHSPKVAILREQGINGHIEMAAAFSTAGFESHDVHMTDLITGHRKLGDFDGLVLCGGFSYGDVLGAGGGWASNILFNSSLKDQFAEFFNRDTAFTLGVCNGCQALSALKEIIPQGDNWGPFQRNLSKQFESRTTQVTIANSNSIFFEDMAGWSLPIVVAHGEGRLDLNNKAYQSLLTNNQIAMHFTDREKQPTNIYPINPNGSFMGATAITAGDGRITAMMPHPERTFLNQQFSWTKDKEIGFSPWHQMFRNAYKFTSS